MGTCRETQDIIYYIQKRMWKSAWHWIKHFNKTTFKDTFMRFPCMVLGHKLYIYDFEIDEEYAEYACKRCGKFIRKNIPKLDGLSINDTKLINFIEQETRKKVTYRLEDSHIKIFWEQFGSDGLNNEEAFKIGRLHRDITNYLKWRLMEFYYGGDKQFVYFRRDDDPKINEYKAKWEQEWQKEIKEHIEKVKLIKNKI